MDLLWLAVILQMLFFIAQNSHYSVLIFIISSLIIQFVTKNQLYFIIIPMVIAHLFHLYVDTPLVKKIEQFKFGVKLKTRSPVKIKKNGIKFQKPKLRVKVKVPKTIKKIAKSSVKVARAFKKGGFRGAFKELKKQTGINKKQKKKIRQLEKTVLKLQSKTKRKTDKNIILSNENNRMSRTLGQIYNISSSDT
jgi:hypothetical protein